MKRISLNPLKHVPLTILGFLSFIPEAFAQGFADRVRGGVNAAGQPAGLTQSASLADIIGGIINAVLGLLGVFLFVLLVYAGFLWMTAGGNEENVKKAKGLIKNGIIGLIIIASAYAIANFVLVALGNATSGPGVAG